MIMPKTPSADDAKLTTDAFVGQIKDLCVGLVYVSEEDFGPEPFRCDPWKMPLSGPNLIASLNLRETTPYEERDWDHFFAVSIPRNKGWADMQQCLEGHLTDRHHLVLGSGHVDHYLIGTFRGVLVGIKNHAIDT